MDLNFVMALGIGDMLISWGALEGVKHEYEKIHIFPCWEIITSYRNNRHDYRQFVLDFAKLIFTDEKYVIHAENSTKCSDVKHVTELGIPCRVPRAQNLLCDSNHYLSKPYIVIPTKIRGCNRSTYNMLKDRFYEALNRVSDRYDIVILGEREVQMNAEYVHLGNNLIYGIYNDIVSCVKKIVDLSIPKLGIDIPDLNNLRKDCSIMRDARSVITFGNSGGFSLSSAVINHQISYRDDLDTWIYHLYLQQQEIVTCTDVNTFINAIDAL